MRIAVQGISTNPIAYTLADSKQEFQLGTLAFGNETDPTAVANAGNSGGQFFYVKAAGAHVVGAPVQVDKDWNIAALPNTAGTGKPVYFAASEFTADNLWGWVQFMGQCPIKVSAATAAGPLYISGAGTVAGDQANGKQILGASALVGSTGSFTKANCKTVNGSKALILPDINGIYNGLTVSGTGIPASSEITNIVRAGGMVQVTMSEAATANGVVTLTFTHTGYVIGLIGCPHVQGQVA